jgi:hypothetical protein
MQTYFAGKSSFRTNLHLAHLHPQTRDADLLSPGHHMFSQKLTNCTYDVFQVRLKGEMAC